MITIRKGTTDDLEAAFLAAPKFSAEAPEGYRSMVLSYERLQETLEDLMSDGIFLVAEHGHDVIGYTGAVLGSAFFSKERMAMEVFWWVEPAHRGGRAGLALFNALEAAAKEAGATRLVLLTLEGENARSLEKLYTHRGYTLFERAYIKEI